MLQAQRARYAYLLILPSLALITLLKLYPTVEALVVSFQRQNFVRPDPEAFVGLAHYLEALVEDDAFWPSLRRSIVWTLGAVGGSYVVGLSIALLLDRDLRGRAAFRALFLIPWVIPDVAAALLWKWLYGDEVGILNFLFVKFGLVSKPIQFLADPGLAMASVIFVQVWKLYPVMFIVLLAALQNVPRELHEAADIDGAGAWQRFRYVTFPFIRPTSVVITLLGAIWTFQNFDLVYLLTGGGPADATEVLPTLVYKKGFWALEIGYASAIGVLMLLCLVALSVAYLFAYRVEKGQGR
jgi:multiple sugar transport system permease protein